MFSSYFSMLSLAPLSTAPLDSKALARYLARHLCMAKSRGRSISASHYLNKLLLDYALLRYSLLVNIKIIY